MTPALAAALKRTADLNTDRLCESCGCDWRGAAECPMCGHVNEEQLCTD